MLKKIGRLKLRKCKNPECNNTVPDDYMKNGIRYYFNFCNEKCLKRYLELKRNFNPRHKIGNPILLIWRNPRKYSDKDE
jgi:hypothetical protein